MRITGKWEVGDDGIVRPLLCAEVQAADGSLVPEDFLIDPGADRTVFSAALLTKLGLAGSNSPPGVSLSGVRGQTPYVLLSTAILLPRDDGGTARVQGQIAAFTDPAATDVSLLGRDVLDHFDVIISKPRDEVLLLAGTHRYVVQEM